MAWGTRVISAMVAMAVAALATGAVYEVFHDVRARGLTPPGRLVRVDDVEQHIHCVGAGAPTVVLEAGAFGAAVSWTLVQARLAETTRVCAYDRAGLAWSAPRSGDVDGPTRVRQLRALLRASGETGPYVMVGHSYGGVLVREFHRQFPQEVRGLGLIDASSPGQSAAIANAGAVWALHVRLAEGLPPAAVHIGLPRALNSGFYRSGYRDLPPTAFQAVTHFAADPAHRAASGAELQQGFEAAWAMALASRAGALGELPLAVVSAGAMPRSDFASDEDHARMAGVWSSLQVRLAALSTNSRHVTVDAATHNSLLGVAEHAAETQAAVRWVVAETRR